ncbi:protein of unknown function [Alteromonadaceae bacterium Bs31]|nr:protein of unknown function [Alteromonadaceae bacterium Bs31]
MKKVKINFITDIIAFICFVFLLSTGVIMKYQLPPRSGGWLNIWGLNRHDWGDIHFYLAMVFLSVIAFHLIMHWKWIVSLVAGKTASYSLGEENRRRVLIGVAALLALLALALAPIVSFYI